MSNITLPFKDKEFTTIYADPPWLETGGGKIKRGADKHYDLLKTSEIIAMESEVKRVTTDNSHCYLWVTNNFLPDGLKVLNAWGYKYKTVITWVKPTIGIGQYFRGMSEHCLFGVRGVFPYRLDERGKRMQGRTIINAPKQEHSKKPNEMRQMIEKVSYSKYLELFGRGKAPENWIFWGYESIND